VFRDEASLAANPDLWPSIETALLGSRWLILLVGGAPRDASRAPCRRPALDASRAARRADVALSRQLAAQSADSSDDSPALAALLAVEAYRTSATPGRTARCCPSPAAHRSTPCYTASRSTLVVRMSKSTSQIAFVANDRLAAGRRRPGRAGTARPRPHNAMRAALRPETTERAHGGGADEGRDLKPCPQDDLALCRGCRRVGGPENGR